MRVIKICSVMSLLTLALCLVAPAPILGADEMTQWLNHLEFLPADATIATEFNAGLGGLEVTASDAAESFLEQGLQAPPGHLVNGVRVCYVLNSTESIITRISLAQLQNPLDPAQVLLDDMTSQSEMGPVCVDSAPPFGDPINPVMGPLSLRLGVNIADPVDNIVILGVALLTIPDPNSPMLLAIQQLQSDLQEVEGNLQEVEGNLQEVEDDLREVKDNLQNHTHTYMTGRGVGHNNTMATTGSSSFSSESSQTEPVTLTLKKKGKKKPF